MFSKFAKIIFLVFKWQICPVVHGWGAVIEYTVSIKEQGQILFNFLHLWVVLNKVPRFLIVVYFNKQMAVTNKKPIKIHQKDDFNHWAMCEAPVLWPKYTTADSAFNKIVFRVFRDSGWVFFYVATGFYTTRIEGWALMCYFYASGWVWKFVLRCKKLV